MFATHDLWTLLTEGALVLALVAVAYLLFERHRHRAAPHGASVTPETSRPSAMEHLLIAEHAANDGIWYWDRERDRAHFSPRWKELLGFGNSDIGSSSGEWFGRIHPADSERVQLELYSHICGETPHFESKHRVLAADGSYRPVFTRGLAVRNADGVVTRLGGSLTDVSPLVEAEQRLVSEALRDELTGLPNRAYFTEVLERCASRALRREEYQFALLFIDLDGFKAVNDSFGHEAGDKLLAAVARKLEACVRPGDVVARQGGDEFTVLLDDIDSGSDATRIAARILASLRSPVRFNARDMTVTGSIGIALNDGHGTTDDLLRSADLAMYRAKSRGRGRYEVFDRAMHAEAVARLRLESELRKGMEGRQFELFYQPLVDPRGGTIRGLEVLMRWNHPERGVVPADDFITVANQTGLIVPLGAWMLRESCQQVARWQEMFPSTPPLTLSVNLCRREMQSPDLLGRIDRLLAETGLRHGSLRIEITESGISESYDATPELYHSLERMGVEFHIDDFGTGASSLSLLNRFPVSAVKIDRSFIFDIGHSEESRDVVRYVSAIARAMDVEVIAEGVETEEQERWLGELNCCTLLQGYRYSRPIVAIGAERLLKQQCIRANQRAG